jgi:hypothetical protein
MSKTPNSLLQASSRARSRPDTLVRYSPVAMDYGVRELTWL